MTCTLAERLLLLTFDPRRRLRHHRHGPRLPVGLAGAVIAELALRDGVRISHGLVSPGPVTTTDDVIHQELLTQVQGQRAAQTVTHWVVTAARPRIRLQTRLLGQLARHGVLRNKAPRFLPRYQLADPTSSSSAAAALRDTLSSTRVPDARAATLCTIAAGCGLLDDLVPRPDLPVTRSRVAAVAGSDPLAAAVGRAVADAAHQAQTRTQAAGVLAAVLAGAGTA